VGRKWSSTRLENQGWIISLGVVLLEEGLEVVSEEVGVTHLPLEEEEAVVVSSNPRPLEAEEASEEEEVPHVGLEVVPEEGCFKRRKSKT